MIAINLHTNGKTVDHAVAVAEISEVIKHRGELLWVDVCHPSDDDLRVLQQEFGFHPLAMEDVARRNQRPKVDSYDGYSLLVFYGIVPATNPASTFGLEQLGLFMGRNFVVTVHEQPIPALDETCDRWRNREETVQEHQVGLLVYSILDAIVDAYFPILDDISDRMEAIEERIFSRFDAAAQQEIFRTKKELVNLRRVVAPERDVINVFLRRDAPLFDNEVMVYFQDIYDHILRVTDAVDTYRDLLTSALDFHLAATSNRLNQVMKTLTASSIILMGMTLVASVYGMNFVHMPELRWHYGYAYALGLMAVIGVGLLAVFRRIDWL